MARAVSLSASPSLTKIHSKTLPICPFLPPFFPFRIFTFSISSRRASTSVTCTSRNAPPARVRAPSPSLFSEGRDEDESRLVCPGCGIFMQDSDPNLPGFYQKPTSPASKSGGSDIHLSDPDDVLDDDGDELANGSASKSSLVTELEGLMEDSDDPDDFLSDSDEFLGEVEEETDGPKSKSKLDSEFDGFSDLEEEFGDEDEKLKEELDGFTPAGVGYGNVTEETLKKLKKEKISKAEKKRKAREAKMNEEEEAVTVCARCHSLRNYGQAGQTVYVGGLVRLDLTQSSVDTIYITVWASPNVSLHMGKTENADEIRDKHVGIRLQPPVALDRVSELCDWKPMDVKVSGVSWDVNSLDIAVSGLGWFSIGLKGEATVTLWTFDGVEVTQREPLVLDKAPFLERPGFLLPKAISEFIGNQGKMEANAKKMEERMDMLMEAIK